MREIKFRAWDKQINKMIKSPYDYDYNIAIILPSIVEAFGKGLHTRPEPKYSVDHICDMTHSKFILMFFIGLFDKNEKQIFESDILSGQTGYGIEKLEVVYVPPQYKLKTPQGSFVDFESGNVGNFEKYYRMKELKIIGNIYENPELLPLPPKGER